MATRDVTVEIKNQGVMVATWADLDGTDDGKPVIFGFYNDKTVQFTSGAGTVTIQGSNDGTNWSTLNDVNGVDLSALATGSMATIAEAPLYVRPVVAGPATNGKVIIVGSTVR